LRLHFYQVVYGLSPPVTTAVCIWDSHSGQCKALLKGHTERVWYVAFSPDGSRIVSGSNDQTVLIWDSQSGKYTGPPFQSRTAEVHSVAFSPDMTYLLCVSTDNTVECWDLRTGAPMEVGLEGNTKELISITISPNGSRIAAASPRDVANRRLVSPPIESSIYRKQMSF
jgi:WD40 repeat protein